MFDLWYRNTVAWMHFNDWHLIQLVYSTIFASWCIHVSFRRQAQAVACCTKTSWHKMEIYSCKSKLIKNRPYEINDDLQDTFHVIIFALICLLQKSCWLVYHRDNVVRAPSQWEAMLPCKVVSHWLSAHAKWSLFQFIVCLWDRPSTNHVVALILGV